mmetsp:Transcript_13316/g.17788  ORF Transcript_13316/g.17788 Transcript_13316/m.17788 type:complete len:289 (-) Transcript_13316:61-927(-)
MSNNFKQRFAGRVRKTQDDGSSIEIFDVPAENIVFSNDRFDNVEMLPDRPIGVFNVENEKSIIIKKNSTKKIISNGEKRRDVYFGDVLKENSNENLIKEPRDQLFFSRKARPVSNFKPYTLQQYRQAKPEKYYELGKLQPDLNRSDLVAKRHNLSRVKEFSNNLRSINRQIQEKTNHHLRKEKERSAQSKREIALSFAKTIPKPQIIPKHVSISTRSLAKKKDHPKEKKIEQVTIRPHHYLYQNDQNDRSTLNYQHSALLLKARLEQLQAKHDHMRILAGTIQRQCAS